MTGEFQSIGNLTGENYDDESVQSQFAEKQKAIKIKELENATKSKAFKKGFPYIDLAGFPISQEAIALIDEKEAEEISTVCFYYDGSNIKVATTEAEGEGVDKAIEKFNFLKDKYYCRGDLYLISKTSFDYAFKFYKLVPKRIERVDGVSVTEESLKKYSDQFSSFKDLQKQIEKSEVTEIVTVIMAASIKSGASDIHIEAEEEAIKIRFRIDGMLHDVADLNKELWRKIISRLKIITKVKINITDKPQDGRLSIFTSNERIDIRASFLPTNYGESVVMRILRSGTVGLKFEDLGIRDESFDELKKQVERPNGMIITTGPTGSGKTTTLYAILKKLKKEETKIITIEDPVEYQLEGVNQSQVGKNYTFAKAMRSIVRQDPDIIMVGEIRDLETAETGIQAALTGHLVLSTIHTNDAAGAIPRFLSMGVKPFLLAPALNAVIGQRLVRRLCTKCKTEHIPDGEEKEKIKSILEKLPEKYREKYIFENLKFYESKGCEACQGIGYKGRIGIYEIMVINDEIEKVVLSGQISEYDLRKISVKKGMVTMAQDGILKAADGVTSIKEVFRVAEEK
jgi:type II secretory ATPase GspE/PulE/Tfp pilus assembly ATPase PilB-like protein